jgi:hypothetical protein
MKLREPEIYGVRDDEIHIVGESVLCLNRSLTIVVPAEHAIRDTVGRYAALPDS